MAPQKVTFNFLLIFLSFSIGSLAEEVNIQVNLKRPVNVVSDKYVSFSIDPNILLENINSTDSEISDFMAKQLRPSYLKISGNSFFTLLSALSSAESIEELKDNVAQSVWMNFNKWIRSVDWLPIVPLPYNPKKWDSIHALRVLNISNSLGVKDCIWQLGIDFDPTDAPRYVDDLTTLKNVVDAFDDSPNHWGVVGADISAGSSRDETRLYVDLAHEVVEAIGWVQPAEYSSYENQNHIVDDRDLALRAILSRDLPAWLTIPPKMLKNSKNVENCSALCITEGLQWAQILGDAARTGFSVVFKPLDKSDIVEPGFSFFISWLFKKTMGEEVFDTRIMSGDRYISHFYTHCTKDLSGAITIMGVNMGDVPSKITAKLSNKYSGPELWQYVLNVVDGVVKLNGEKVRMNSTFEPLVKIKHPSRPTTLVLPPLSIGFWILPSANHRECSKEDEPEKNVRMYNDYEYDRSGRLITSSDRLLQQLIKENIAKGNAPVSNRLKRHIVVKKDSNYLNQLVKDVDRQTYNQYTKSTALARQKRFILKNQNRPRLFQNLFESVGLGGAGGAGGAVGMGGLGNLGLLGGFGGDRTIAAPAPPPPPPPPQLETPVEDNRRFKRVFPRLPLMKLEQLFQNRKTRRAKRQAMNLFKLGPFSNAGKDNRPKLFSGLRNMMAPAAKTVPDKRLPNEEELLAPRKDVQFPEGDIHVNLTKIPDADYDYVEFDAADRGALPRRFVDARDNTAFRHAPNALHETFSITQVVPRVEKALVPQTSSTGKGLSGANLDSAQLELARKQLQTYYMPAPPPKASGEDFVKGKSDEELGTPVQTRKRRNAVLKSLSWALNQGDKHLSNIIEREEAEQANSMPIFERVRPFLRLQKYDRSAKPRSLEELQTASAEVTDNLVLHNEDSTTRMTEMELNEDEPDLAKIRIIAEAPGSNPQTPKFMNYLTSKLNRFMDMVNSHVTGWWNTWV